MSYTSELENVKQSNRLLTRILIGMFVLLVLVIIGWTTVQNEMTVHIPPDLRTGAVLDKDEIHTSGVYLFAFYILQQINSWDNNGLTDYPENINRLRHYLTPRFKQQLLADVEKRNNDGELRNRIRSFRQMPGNAFSEKDIEIQGNAWIVWLNIKIKESVLGHNVKAITMRYPIKVVRYDVNRELNPWGLALDGSGGRHSTQLRDQ